MKKNECVTKNGKTEEKLENVKQYSTVARLKLPIIGLGHRSKIVIPTYYKYQRPLR